MLIDAHNHLQDPRFEGLQDEIIAEMKSAGINRCIVNGTCENDWPQVADLTKRHPEFITPSFGLHPWKITSRSQNWLSQLKSLLEKHQQAGLGECGLDRWIKEPHFEDQKEAFIAQLQLAAKLQRPVTIHCLKAWGPLMEILHDQKELPKFLLHSFGGSLEIAQELTKLGAYFSISGYFFYEQKSAQLEVFCQIPPDRLLIETDAPDMLPPEHLVEFPLQQLNHPANLRAIHEGLQKETQLTPSQLTKNTETFFNLS